VVITIAYGENNDVCSNTATVSRRKRATTVPFDQSLLIDILSQPEVSTVLAKSVVDAVRSQLGENITVTVSQPEVPQQVTTTSATVSTSSASTTSATTQAVTSAPAGVEGWVIAVGVVGALVGLAIIIIVVVVLVKRPRKVASSDTEGQE
jgi:6-pyruvoyl-tetrahydropterin synthase